MTWVDGHEDRALRGISASGGVAIGPVIVMPDAATDQGRGGGNDESGEQAIAALRQVGLELRASAESLRRLGWEAEAEILDTNRMMSEDPALLETVRGMAIDRPAAAAVLEASERLARELAATGDDLLAARAADVRQLGRRAADRLRGRGLDDVTAGSMLVARELGPADVAELIDRKIGGIALAQGAVTSHAAIMSRALGVPMVVSLGETVLQARDGEQMVVDGDEGVAVVHPSAGTVAASRQLARQQQAQGARLAESRRHPPVTLDGQRVQLLCNVGTLHEIEAGLAGGADGVGLLRTELPFLEATAWPSEAELALALEPLVRRLAGRPATVRILDFGEDKLPPFLPADGARGIALMLGHPDMLRGQLRAILRCASATRLRLLAPMVERAEQITTLKSLVAGSMRDIGWTSQPVPVGAMVETPRAVSGIGEIASAADFLSIGTNDLVASTLTLDRSQPEAAPLRAAEPAVLRLVARVADAAREASIPLGVCGEAAAEPQLVRLLVGLGVTELSVAPPRLDAVRLAIRSMSAEHASGRAPDTLVASCLDDALAIADDIRG